MIILITGASHTGKTNLSQKLLEKYKFPYLSIDHLKMGLIRSNNTNLTPLSDDEDLTSYLWPIVCEMIKTAIENNILVNKLSAVLVFVLSAAAGGLIGFMTIRSRKREIALLQVLGTSKRAVLGGLFLEQLICILAGTAIGGICWRWRPLEQLAGFVGVYLLGLMVALSVILHLNLLISIKEEE